MDLSSELRRTVRRSKTGVEVGDLKELVRVRRQSRIRSLVLDNIKEEPVLVQGRREILMGVRELSRQLDWLRSNKRARLEARKLYRQRTFDSKMDALENFCIRSTVLLILLFIVLYVIRAISICVLPELFLECSAAHADLHTSNYSVKNSVWSGNVVDSSSQATLTHPISGLSLRWMLFRGVHPCIPIYMECFALQESITHPYQGQY